MTKGIKVRDQTVAAGTVAEKGRSVTVRYDSTLLALLAIAGVAAYAVAFYCVEMPSLTLAPDKPFVRGQLLLNLFLPESLFECWFGAPPEFSVADRLPVAFLAASIVAWAGALGWLLLKLCRLDRGLTRLETFVFATAVGLNAVSTYVLAMGLLGWLERAAFVAPALATFAAALWVRHKNKVCAAVPPQPTSPTKPEENGTTVIPPALAYALAAPLVAILFLGAMLPPVDFDVREYHLQVPKEFLQQGRIGFLPHNVYGNMPLGTEMLSLLAMVVSGDWWLGALAGKTVLASYALLTALGLLAAGRRLANETAGTVAALVYVSIPWVIQVSTLGLVDAALGCYLFLAFYAVCLAQGTSSTEYSVPSTQYSVPGTRYSASAVARRVSMFVLAGYLAGGAASCKYPGLLFVVVPLAVWVLLARRPSGGIWRPAWKPTVAFVLAAVAGCGLWFAKNCALTGNPTYPLLYSAFGGETRTPDKDRQWNAAHRPHDFSMRTLGRDAARVVLTSEWLSPLVIPLAALGFAARRRVTAGLASYFALVVVAWWLLTHRIDRFWIPALPLAAMLAGIGATWSQDRVWRSALVVLLIAGTAANSLAASSWYPANAYFVSLDRVRNAPEVLDPWHRDLNRRAREGRTLLVGDAQPFDLEMPVLYNTCFDDSIFEQLVKGRAPQQVCAAFAQHGITHVYVDWDEINRYRRTYGFTDFVQPGVFGQLVADRVLDPILVLPDHRGLYRVVAP